MTDEALKKALKIYGEDADILIIAHKNGMCGSVLHGKGENVAQAIFACMHQPNLPIGKHLYRMLRLIVMNILCNPSPYAANLAETVVNATPDPNDSGHVDTEEVPESGKKSNVVSIDGNGEE